MMLADNPICAITTRPSRCVYVILLLLLLLLLLNHLICLSRQMPKLKNRMCMLVVLSLCFL